MISLELINEQYSLEYKVLSISKMPGYPHLKILETNVNKYILKFVDSKKKRISFMEKMYTELSAIDVVLVPIINNHGCYVTKVLDEVIVIFEYIDLSETVPNMEWWIDTFSKIHSLIAFHQQQEIRMIELFDACEKMFDVAAKYMKKDIKNVLFDLMRTVNLDKKFKVKGVLNHGDPLISNVMKKGTDFKLIDFESVRIFPKDYDLQRFLWGIVIGESNRRNSEKMWKEFKQEYEKSKAVYYINWELLANLYSIDFVTTISWLFIVSNDKNRTDCNRQKKELESYCSALRIGTVQEMLFYILKESGGGTYEFYE